MTIFALFTQQGGSVMVYITYENKRNPHVTIHVDGCGQIRKNGGHHKYKQGKYESHQDYSEAYQYSIQTGLPIINCSFCRPDRFVN